MTTEQPALTVRHSTERRKVFVGACPVLEITVTYPVLEAGGDDVATETFNEGYRRMAEAFLSWGEKALGERVTEEFNAAGAGAAFRFDRRLLICSMEGEIIGEDRRETLRVRRNLRLTSRRGSVEERLLPEARDDWRLPELTLRSRPSSSRGERGKTCKKSPLFCKKVYFIIRIQL
jgi:hypothetical protein